MTGRIGHSTVRWSRSGIGSTGICKSSTPSRLATTSRAVLTTHARAASATSSPRRSTPCSLSSTPTARASVRSSVGTRSSRLPSSASGLRKSSAPRSPLRRSLRRAHCFRRPRLRPPPSAALAGVGMPEKALPLRWRQAALHLEATLRQLTGQAPERLDRATIGSCYPSRRWVAAWRVSVVFSDGVTRRVDVVATAAFPAVPVRTALVDHPDFMTWPHVESDGILCLLPNLAECDPDDPSAVAANLLHRSIRLIEELLEGAIIERDFREEFLTYWAYKSHSKGTDFYSLIAPAPPSRLVQVWKGKGLD
jgi:hypothetical protein